jgi:hypothetical protein
VEIICVEKKNYLFVAGGGGVRIESHSSDVMRVTSLYCLNIGKGLWTPFCYQFALL